MTIETGEGLVNSVVDAAMAEQTSNTEQEATTEATEEATTETQSEPTETPEQKVEKEEPFPKKAINAITKRERQIGKLRAESAYLKQRLQELEGRFNSGNAPEQKPQDNKPSGAPKEDDFDNYGDYLEAKTRWAIREEMAAGNKHSQEQQKSQQDFAQTKAWVDSSVKTMAEEVDKLSTQLPDLEDVTSDFTEIVEDGLLPPHLGAAILHAGKDAGIAVYNICKEGRLNDFLRMNPTQAAIELGRMSRMPINTMGGQKKVSSAPAPVKGASGTSGGQKSLNQMSSKELLDWIKK